MLCQKQGLGIRSNNTILLSETPDRHTNPGAYLRPLSSCVILRGLVEKPAQAVAQAVVFSEYTGSQFNAN